MFLSAAELTAPITGQYFESSVYRNILSMLDALETIRKEMFAETQTLSLSFTAALGPGQTAIGYAINKGAPIAYKNSQNAWRWYAQPLFIGKRVYPPRLFSYGLFARKPPPIPGENTSEARFDMALMNLRSISLDLKARIRGLEWELNRVHLPMVDDLRKWAIDVDSYIRNLPSRHTRIDAPPHVWGEDASADLIAKRRRARIVANKANDKTRITGHTIALQLVQLKAWLTTMREKVKERDRTDQAAMIALEKQRKAEAAAAEHARQEAIAASEKERARTAAPALEADRKARAAAATAAAAAELARLEAAIAAAKQHAEQETKVKFPPPGAPDKTMIPIVARPGEETKKYQVAVPVKPAEKMIAEPGQPAEETKVYTVTLPAQTGKATPAPAATKAGPGAGLFILGTVAAGLIFTM